MGPKKIRTRTEDVSAAYAYLKKAEDNYMAMVTALADNNYNAVGTLALQYECRSVYKSEAHDLAKAAKRIFEWVSANIKGR